MLVDRVAESESNGSLWSGRNGLDATEDDDPARLISAMPLVGSRFTKHDETVASAGVYWSQPVPDAARLWSEVELVWESAEDDDLTAGRLTIGTCAVVTSALSAGYIVWLLRGGYLLAALASSIPAWQLLDPLPILELARQTPAGHRDGESLQWLVEEEDSEPRKA
jgi:hypothetical protein